MLETNNYKFNNKGIERLWYIFMGLSDTTYSSIEISIGYRGVCAFSCETMMSVMKTLETIDFCCGRGAYGDAYTLVRKVRDDIFQYLFLLDVIKRNTGLRDDELEGITFDEKNIVEIIEREFQIMQSGDRKDNVDFAVEFWLYNEIDSKERAKERKTYFDTSKYMKYLTENNTQAEYIMKTFFEMIWKDIDRKLNNYVHTNGLKYLHSNYTFNFDKEKCDDKLNSVLNSVVDIFLAILSIVDSVKMRSSDYLDSLELGLKPEENSQYWVMPAIVEYMNERFDKKLLEYIQKNENNGMRFLGEFYCDE